MKCVLLPNPSDNPAVFPVQSVVFAVRGTNATMAVTITGSPYPSPSNITWMYAGGELEESDRYSFENAKRHLIIRDVSEGDYGSYRCTVSTEAGSDSTSLQLVEPGELYLDWNMDYMYVSM